jgi:C1A family cysteine protease
MMKDAIYNMKKIIIMTAILFILVSIIGLSSNAFSDSIISDDPQITGLPELSDADIDWQNKHMLKVKKVKMNKLALERVNEWRISQGKKPISENQVDIVDNGQEIEGSVGESSTVSTADITNNNDSVPSADIPPYIDNSTLKYFPPIKSQGSLNSCGVFNGTYYAMTYMYAFANDLDAKNGGDGYRLSPKWTYNMVNSGENVGTWYYQAYEIGQKNGCATWQEFPYTGSTSNPVYYREWSTDKNVWRNAINKKIDQYGYVSNTHLDSGIEQVKQMLLNGCILNFPTYINSWQWKTISNDPSTTADDAFAGKNCAYWVNGTNGYHAMTVVGYNDNIWIDINGNGTVDSGENGAFRIANSWGTGWGEGGFAWMAYDALKNPSAVFGAPSSGRVYGWSPSRAHWVTAKTGYNPSLVAEISLLHSERDQLRLTLGVSDTNSNSPSSIWYSKMISFQGGSYAFNGTSTPVEGNFVLDFTDIVPSGGGTYRYYVGISDREVGLPAEILSYKLIDVASGIEISSNDAPASVDNQEIFIHTDYSYDDGNIPPAAIISTDILEGLAPLAINFDGISSFDSDGSIISFKWEFGDGTSGIGNQTSHVYTTGGTYTAKLTVTDNLGASGTSTIVIKITSPPPEPIHIADIAMSLSYSGANASAKGEVYVVDKNGLPISNAVVYGAWSGLVKSNVSATTNSNGIATLTSLKSKKSGTFQLTITNITANNYYYDSSINVETSDYINK